MSGKAVESTSNVVYLIIISVAAMLSVLLVNAPEVSAEDRTFVVTSNADSGPGSLREAWNNAIFYSEGINTITFDLPEDERTIALQSNLETSDRDIIIDGDDEVTISGGGSAYIFDVIYTVLILRDITLTDSTRAITGNYSYLTIDSSDISGNVGGGIYAYKTRLLIKNSTFYDNAGSAVRSEGLPSTVIRNSTFSGNSATSGSAIANYDTVESDNPNRRRGTRIINSTIEGNSTTGTDVDDGGAIFNYAGYVELRNTTVTNNSSASENAGGVFSVNSPENFPKVDTTTRFVASIVSGNASSGGLSDISLYSEVEDNPGLSHGSGGGNVVGVVEPGAGQFDRPGDVSDVSVREAFGTDSPTLEDNGGVTETVALGEGSVAIDRIASDRTGLTTVDQRGLKRPQLLGIDTGAYEYDGPAPAISDIKDRTVRINGGTAQIAFMVADTKEDPAKLKVSARSSNTSLIPNSGIKLYGSGGDRAVKVVPTKNRTGSAEITLTVTDSQGLKDSETFVVTVKK